ncbi:MAG: DNA translocase FtsK 4TM domain-containing protein [Proteobacteria bacterium]|nr:DNA translocase FtsK 4TM domain-containing protein [Pseudomonadota bacterium]
MARPRPTPPKQTVSLASVCARFIGAFVCLAGAAWLFAALSSFEKSDPSWNTAVAGQVQNICGIAGAYVADAFFQFLGPVGFLVPVILTTWGVSLCVKRPVSWWGARLFAAFVSVGVGCLLFAKAGTKGSNLIGQVLLIQSAPVSAQLGGGFMALLCVASVISLFFALNGRLKDLRALAGLMRPLKKAPDFAGAAQTSFEQLFARARARANDAEKRRIEPGMHGHPMPAQEPGVFLDEDAPLSPQEEAPAMAITIEREARPVSVKKPAPSPKASKDTGALDLSRMDASYQLPSLELLAPPIVDKSGDQTQQMLQESAQALAVVLDDYGVRGDITRVCPGPVVTLYELTPAPGVKSSRVTGLSDDIARSMCAASARVAVVPGKNALGIELPNAVRQTVYLRELMTGRIFDNSSAKLALALGKDIGGNPIIADLARMPHLLVAGTTGSGKSVAINTMILSLLYRLSPKQCRFIMIDPKMLELSVYNDIPHLLCPVVTEPKKAIYALKWAVREMEDRYRAMSRVGVRNIEGYNARLSEAVARGEVLSRQVHTGFDPDTGKPIYETQPLDMSPLPYIVVIVDEMADLMMVAGKEIEMAVQRLAQMARAAGIHLIMATQRPSVDVITGTIKANFPTRISFQVTSKFDSRTILGEQGAEQLLGRGDMLFMEGGGRIGRVHGPFVSDEEVERIVAHLKDQGVPDYIDNVTDESGDAPLESFGDPESGADSLYTQAVSIVTREGKASTSFIQRQLQIGYNKAARIMEQMEAEGVVSTANHAGKREVLVKAG